MALWRKIGERGYSGTSRQVHRFERRTKPTRSGRKSPKRHHAHAGAAGRGTVVTDRAATRVAAGPADLGLDAAAAAVVARVERDTTAGAIADLARHFTALVRASGGGRTATCEIWDGKRRGRRLRSGGSRAEPAWPLPQDGLWPRSRFWVRW